MNALRGFTLVELLVSLTIIGILSSIVFATFTSSQAQARDQERQTQLKEMQLAMERYYNQNGGYPEPDSTCPGYSATGLIQVNNEDCPDGFLSSLVPDYLDEVPTEYDYKYELTSNRQDYRLAATGVEELTVDGFDHPFAYCPRPTTNGNICDGGPPPPNMYSVYSENGWLLP